MQQQLPGHVPGSFLGRFQVSSGIRAERTKVAPKPRELTLKQRRFVLEYVKDGNATQAATRAGYSAKTANEQGARLLAKVSVRKLLEEKRAQVEPKLEMTRCYHSRHMCKAFIKISCFAVFNVLYFIKQDGRQS